MEEGILEKRIVTKNTRRLYLHELVGGSLLSICSPINYILCDYSNIHILALGLGLLASSDGISRLETGYGLIYHIKNTPEYISRYFEKIEEKNRKEFNH